MSFNQSRLLEWLLLAKKFYSYKGNIPEGKNATHDCMDGGQIVLESKQDYELYSKYLTMDIINPAVRGRITSCSKFPQIFGRWNIDKAPPPGLLRRSMMVVDRERLLELIKTDPILQ